MLKTTRVFCTQYSTISDLSSLHVTSVDRNHINQLHQQQQLLFFYYPNMVNSLKLGIFEIGLYLAVNVRPEKYFHLIYKTKQKSHYFSIATRKLHSPPFRITPVLSINHAMARAAVPLSFIPYSFSFCLLSSNIESELWNSVTIWSGTEELFFFRSSGEQLNVYYFVSSCFKCTFITTV